MPKLNFGKFLPLAQEGKSTKKVEFGKILPLEQEGKCAKKVILSILPLEQEGKCTKKLIVFNFSLWNRKDNVPKCGFDISAFGTGR